MSEKDWADMNKKERANLVRSYLIDKGYSYGQLATALGVTRNTIAGICNREGIKVGTRGKTVVSVPASPTPPDNVIPFPVAKRPEEGFADMAKKLKAKRKASVQSTAVQRMTGRALDMDSLFVRDPRPLRDEFWKPLPSSAPVRLEHTQAHHCRWPISDDNHTCCGAPAKEGKPYCATHCEIAYRTAPPIDFTGRKKKTA